MRAGLVLGETFQALRRNMSMAVSVVLVTFVSLTFVGAAVLMQVQVAKTNSYFQDRAQVDVYMCSPLSTTATCVDGVATEEQIAMVRSELQGPTLSPLIDTFVELTPQEAYDATIESLGQEYATLITPEQTSAEFGVTMVNPAQSDVIVEAFAGVNGIEEVTDQRAYLDPLFRTLAVATYIAVGIAAVMLISAALLVATTIRLSAIVRRKSVMIMRFVGASNRFIRAPFILEGVLAASIGALLAGAALVAAVHYGVDGALASADSPIPWVGLPEVFAVIPALLVIGALLAAISASFAIRRALKT